MVFNSCLIYFQGHLCFHGWYLDLYLLFTLHFLLFPPCDNNYTPPCVVPLPCQALLLFAYAGLISRNILLHLICLENCHSSFKIQLKSHLCLEIPLTFLKGVQYLLLRLSQYLVCASTNVLTVFFFVCKSEYTENQTKLYSRYLCILSI